METLLDRFKRDHGPLRRSRSVRASLRLIGNKWRTQKDDKPEDIEKLRSNSIVTTQVWSGKSEDLCVGVQGTYLPKTPIMAKRKHEVQRRRSGDIDLVLKPQKPVKVEKSKLSDLFSNKKYKSYSAKELPVAPVPDTIPPKAAALLHIHSPDGKENKIKKKLKGMGKSESARSVTEQALSRRVRRGSESDMCSGDNSVKGGCVNRAFVYSTPPKDRRTPISPNSYLKLQYGALLEGCGGELGSLSACSPLPPHPDKLVRRHHKDQGKIPEINIHLQALFAAVEHGHIDKARNILESTDVDVNSVNSDGLSPLDVAVLVNNIQLAKTLMEFGAKEGTQFKDPEALAAHLRRLSREAEARLHEVVGCAPERSCRDDAACTRGGAGSNAGGAGTTGCAGGAGSERDKQALHWERRVKALKRLVLGWQQCRPPPMPAPPLVEVCGSHSVTVTLPTTGPQQNSPIITKYRVEWASRADFSNVCGARELCARSALQVDGLTRGRRYFFRAAAANLRGWGAPEPASPRSVVPSSWRDASSGAGTRQPGAAAAALDSLAAALDRARPAPAPPRAPRAPRAPRKKGAAIRQLFTAASKYQKNLRRGVYLACVLYHEDKVLVTSEEFLPVIEVDETYPTCIYSDFHWLMKVSCSWDDVKALRTDMERHTSSSLHFRLKLLTAVTQMQSALSLQDLGCVYHKPLRDAAGTLVLSLVRGVRGVRAAKALSPLNCRWAPALRLRRRPLGDDNAVADLLLASLPDQIHYHQASTRSLPRGLYAGYLKLQSSVECVRIAAPAAAPAVPPHRRLRDNPHVSAEEWDYLKSQSSNFCSDDIKSNLLSINSGKNDKTPSESQQIFLEQVSVAARRLFKDMEVDLEAAKAHRIYDLEVIELNSDVSFIMICPPAELACSVPGQKEMLLQRGDLLSLPIQAFEMIHLQTYHNNMLSKYAKLSCVLELEVAFANHSQREAFSSSELQIAKERLNKLEDLQNNLNTVWKAERWLMDLIGFAREKDKGSSTSGIVLKNILEKTPSLTVGLENQKDKDTNLKIDLLQIPSRDGKIKSSPGRGSWPGPAGNGNHNLHPEFSKSEQQLSLAPRQTSASTLNLSSQYISAEANKYSRKNSADSQYTQSSNNYSSNSQFDTKSTGSHTSINNNKLPPSRSEDTLVLQSDCDSTRPHSIATTMSTTSSPLLTVKGFYPGSMISVKTKSVVSESVQSLSSDSESQSCPINSSLPVKNRPQSRHKMSHFISSKSMTNVKSDVDYTDTGQDLFVSTIKRQSVIDNKEESDGSFKVPKTEDRLQSHDEIDEEAVETVRQQDQPGILQVFAAYETGLAMGTSLKLHVTPRTSAREVINLVVKQLNMAAVLKGKSGPVYGAERLQDFCLVAVIGARERCLRDDFRPLQLQNPWRKGRLYVRLKHDVLAALNHSAKQVAFI